MNKDQQLLEEAYSSMNIWDKWLSELKHTINPDGTIDVEGDVDLTAMKLKKLPFKFGKVTGDFYCRNNKLTSLEGAPTSVGGSFYCYYNKLTSLKGGPTSVEGDFYCNDNELTSLEGAPTSVGGVFYCRDNQLTSLKYLPKAAKYFVKPLTQADVERELERQDLEKHMNPTAKAAWGTDVFADL